MDREIKFRVWTGSTMEYNVIAGKFGVFYVNPGKNGDGLNENDRACLTTFNTIYSGETPVMQFTGLKDKNGTEIYEGDIILLNCGADDGATIRHKITATIDWNINRWFARIPDKKVTVIGGSQAGREVSWREIHTWCGMHDCLSDTWVKREVVGNIHENPELLEAIIRAISPAKNAERR